MALVALTIAICTAWDLTLVVLATLPISIAVLNALALRLQPLLIIQAEESGLASARVTTAISAIETVKCFHGEEFELSQYACCLDRVTKQYGQQTRITALQNGFVKFVALAIFAQGFWYGSFLVKSGGLTSGEIVTVFWACITLSYALQRMLPLLLKLQKGRIAAESLLALVSYNALPNNLRHACLQKTQPCSTGDILFSDVSALLPKYLLLIYERCPSRILHSRTSQCSTKSTSSFGQLPQRSWLEEVDPAKAHWPISCWAFTMCRAESA